MNWFLFLFLSRERERERLCTIFYHFFPLLPRRFRWRALTIDARVCFCVRYIWCIDSYGICLEWKIKLHFFFRDFTAIYWTMVGAPQLKFTHNFSDVFVQFEIQHCFVGMKWKWWSYWTMALFVSKWKQKDIKFEMMIYGLHSAYTA